MNLFFGDGEFNRKEIDWEYGNGDGYLFGMIAGDRVSRTPEYIGENCQLIYKARRLSV